MPRHRPEKTGAKTEARANQLPHGTDTGTKTWKIYDVSSRNRFISPILSLSINHTRIEPCGRGSVCLCVIFAVEPPPTHLYAT